MKVRVCVCTYTHEHAHADRGWEWQKCNELGGFLTDPGNDHPFGGNHISLESVVFLASRSMDTPVTVTATKCVNKYST